MHRYIVKRLLMLIPVIAGVSFMVFFILSLSPGDPVKLMLGDQATDEAIAQLREELSLDEPLIVQYGKYMWNLVRGDMGQSYTTKRDVFTEIRTRFPVTLKLAVFSMLISIVIAIPIGIISATRQYSFLDNISMVACLVGVSNAQLGWVADADTAFLCLARLASVWRCRWAASYVLPALTLGIGGSRRNARMMRSSMLEVIRQTTFAQQRLKA